MAQSKLAALTRWIVMVALIAGLAASARGVLAEGKDGEGEEESGATVVIHGGNHSYEANITLDASGVEGTADGSGGDLNTGSTSGGDAAADGSATGVEATGDVATGGNGGDATSDGSGGTLYSPESADGGLIPIAETGGNSGSTINVGDVSAGDGTVNVNIYGGDTSVVTDVTLTATGGTSNADASGGSNNVATVLSLGAGVEVSGSLAAAGNGGTANASAAGGSVPVGTILGGNNQGATINVGDITGGLGNGGDVDVNIHGGTLSATTISVMHLADGGLALADGSGGDFNTALVVGGTGDQVLSGNGGTGTASANGGVATIGVVDGPLYSIIGGNNRGATINLAGVSGGDGWHGGSGGDATVDIYGGDLAAYASSIGSPAYAGGNIGADIDAGHVGGGDGSWGGNGGDATLGIDGGSISAWASAPAGADAGDNRGATILVGATLGGDGAGGDGGDATVLVEGSDISASGFGLEIEPPLDYGDPVVSLPYGGAGASAGEGGIAFAEADAGSASTGPVFAGDNVGSEIRVGDTIGGDGTWGGQGGDATVQIAATDITTWFGINAAVDGGSANSSALGGADNVANLTDVGLLTTDSAAAGSGGFAGARANGGNILVGTIYVGGNHGGVINVGDTIGGAGEGGTGGDATVALDGGSITATVLLNLEALGGQASASANGGAANLATVLGDGTLGNGGFAGSGGVALAEANGGTIVVGDVHVGGNLGAVMTVGDTVGGDGSWGGQGGDATLTVDGTDILSAIVLNLAANGGIADASANGGGGNTALLDPGAAELIGVQVLAGNGGIANARANGGTILVGDLFAGGNVGTVVEFGDIVGGDACCGGEGESQVFHRFGGQIISVTELTATAHGGAAAANADGGSNNTVILLGDATDLESPVRAGNGGTSLVEANGGLITVASVTSGFNRGTVFVGPEAGEHDGGKPDDGKPGPGKPGERGKPDAGKPGVGKPGAGGKPGAATGGKVGAAKRVRGLPNTGAGTVAGHDSLNDALLLLGAVVVVAGTGYGLRRRSIA